MIIENIRAFREILHLKFQIDLQTKSQVGNWCIIFHIDYGTHKSDLKLYRVMSSNSIETFPKVHSCYQIIRH